MDKNILAIILLFFFFKNDDSALAANITVNLETTVIDGNSSPFNQLLAGDTVFLMPGMRDFLLIRNFRGKPQKPFVFINQTGIVRINTNHIYGISIQDCRHFKLTGSGDKSIFYGIQIDRVANGAGIGVGSMSSDYEIDHISIKNVPIGGVYAKTDPDCSLLSTRDKFIQTNTQIHDMYIENAGNEGIYAGSTAWLGQNVTCNGKDTLLFPATLEGVKIYKNIIKNSGWDGIQVSSATRNCQVYDNQIYNDSQAEYTNQMSGILLGGGSRCDCYNNLIIDGKGDGIENHGLGGNLIFNNIIVNAGKNYYPNDYEASKMKHGIFLSDISTLPDSSFYILNNTIINPKSDGIRFSSSKSKRNLIASNAIINPGNFDYYQSGNLQFTGSDSYIMIPSKQTEVTIRNNFMERDLSKAGMANDYSLLNNSPLIDAAYTGNPTISFDFTYNQRPMNGIPDIGAFEYNPNTGTSGTFTNSEFCIVFPNPATDEINILLPHFSQSRISIIIRDISGKPVLRKDELSILSNRDIIRFSVRELNAGLYFVTAFSEHQLENTKFLKID